MGKFLGFILAVGVFILCAVGYFYFSTSGDRIEAADIAVGPAGEKIVIIGNRGFKPENVVVERGKQVKWVNGSQEAHTITFGLNSSLENMDRVDKKLNPNESLTFKFEKQGKFGYFDKVSNFTGTVEVK